jgi:hypothetical protein
MSNSKVRGYLTYQVESNGLTSDDRLDSIAQSLTPSASALAKALKGLDSVVAEPVAPTETQEKTEENTLKSTVTYHFDIESGQALVALNQIDRTGNTEAYDVKLNALNEKRNQYGEVKELPLNARINALKDINTRGFRSYSYQITIVVPGAGEAGGDAYIKSKKHHRLEAMSESSLKALLKAYNVAWKNNSSKVVEPAQS